MIYFIKRFTQVDCTQINCIPSYAPLKRSTTWRTVYSMATTHPFFKAELFIIGTNKFDKFLNKAIFENFQSRIVARVNHNLLTVANRRTVHQWHTSSLNLNERYHTLNFIYTDFGVTLLQHANTISNGDNFFLRIWQDEYRFDKLWVKIHYGKFTFSVCK